MSDVILDILNGSVMWLTVMYMVFLIGYSTFLFLSATAGSATLYRKHKKARLKNLVPESHYVPISVIIPAHNEDITVVSTVRSILELDYTVYEIIVVDDGSTDDTAKNLIDAYHLKEVTRPVKRQIDTKPVISVYETFQEKVPIRLICKVNGGKADALNVGINTAEYPYFICIDADSALQYNSLREIVRPVLEEADVVAVGGAVRPANGVEIEHGRVENYHLPKNILARMQTLEYDRSFLASRILFDSYNGSLIISGAFGLFRKDVIVGCGGYDSSIIGEDMELVVKLHEYCIANKIPYRIRYAENAICWSQVPERIGDLCKQRRRWQTGLYQSLKIHRTIFNNPQYGLVSYISYLYYLIFELASPYIEIIGFIATVICCISGLIVIQSMISFLLVCLVFVSILSLTIFYSRVHTLDLKVPAKDIASVALLCVFELVFIHFLLLFARVTAIRRKKNVWGEIKRKKLEVS